MKTSYLKAFAPAKCRMLAPLVQNSILMAILLGGVNRLPAQGQLIDPGMSTVHWMAAVDSGGWILANVPGDLQIVRYSDIGNPIWSRTYPFSTCKGLIQKGPYIYAVVGYGDTYFEALRLETATGSIVNYRRFQVSSSSPQVFFFSPILHLITAPDGRIAIPLSTPHLAQFTPLKTGYLEINSTFDSLHVRGTYDESIFITCRGDYAPDGGYYNAIAPSSLTTPQGAILGSLVCKYPLTDGVIGGMVIYDDSMRVSTHQVLLRNNRLFLISDATSLGGSFLICLNPGATQLLWARSISTRIDYLHDAESVVDSFLYAKADSHQLVFDMMGNIVAQGVIGQGDHTVANGAAGGRITVRRDFSTHAYIAPAGSVSYCQNSCFTSTPYSLHHTTGTSTLYSGTEYVIMPAPVAAGTGALPTTSVICTATPLAPPLAAYTYATLDSTVTFTNTSPPPAGSWLWDFGDGDTSSLHSPVHTFNTSDTTYTVCLSHTHNCISNTTCQTITVGCPAPQAAFSYSANGLSVQVQQAGTGANFTWDFGDGSTASGPNATHTYTADSSYTICLFVSDSCGADTTCQTVALVGAQGPTRLSITLAPQPADDALHLAWTLDAPASLSLRLHALDGRVLWTESLDAPAQGRIRIPTHALPAGAYLVHAASPSGSWSRLATVAH